MGDNDKALLDSFNHWRKVGYSVQTAMVLALECRGANPGRPEHSVATRSLEAACAFYRRSYTGLHREDLI